MQRRLYLLQCAEVFTNARVLGLGLCRLDASAAPPIMTAGADGARASGGAGRRQTREPGAARWARASAQHGKVRHVLIPQARSAYTRGARRRDWRCRLRRAAAEAAKGHVAAAAKLAELLRKESCASKGVLLVTLWRIVRKGYALGKSWP